MPMFRAKPVTIEAIEFTGTNFGDVTKFVAGASVSYNLIKQQVVIHSLEGMMVASAWDWIIKGTAGEFYPCKPDVFRAKYEQVGPVAVEV